MTRWFYVDGVLSRITGRDADIIETIREQVRAGHTIKAARPPAPIAPRGYATASSHVKR